MWLQLCKGYELIDTLRTFIPFDWDALTLFFENILTWTLGFSV